jgi:hypothetical protein
LKDHARSEVGGGMGAIFNDRSCEFAGLTGGSVSLASMNDPTS